MTPSPSRLRTAIALAATILAVTMSVPAKAADITSLRIMLHPEAAARGTLPASMRARIEAATGTPVALAGTTRTGALELDLPVALTTTEAAALAQRLRLDRGILWVRAQPAAPAVAKSKHLLQQPEFAGRRLMVRLQDDVAPDWERLLPQLSASVGVTLTVERRIADVWVLGLPATLDSSALANVAQVLQGNPEVRYADPVRRAFAQAAPNDPLFSLQWTLSDAVSGINAAPAWALQPVATGVTVAVVDTGTLPHPDLAGRQLAGYDFISDPDSARDGNARDPNPRDEGDWTSGECGFPQQSFFHGLFVSGLIAANTNNGIGIAGLAGGVNLLPVRVLGRCGGTFEDVFAGMLWASGINILGVPSNLNPARVINLSLGGLGACDSFMQEAVDDALAQGAIVVAAAGNATTDVADFTPANCGGVIAVSAHARNGNITSYSNYGGGITVSAPGGDPPDSDLIVSTFNDGTTVPGESGYAYARGTSFAAPLVTGAVAMVLARNPLLTPGHVHDLLQGTARNFPSASQCAIPNLCGAGMLDAGLVIESTFPGGPPPPNAVTVVEYYRADLDHYFITASPIEINYIDRFLAGLFQRTGLHFFAYPSVFVTPPGSQPVCRFYADANVQIDSHYYSASPAECAFVQATWPGIWVLEQANAFYVQVPDVDGMCPANTLPVYRFFNNRRDANHRYTVDLSVRRGMLNRGWAPEGAGTNSVAFCSPI